MLYFLGKTNTNFMTFLKNRVLTMTRCAFAAALLLISAPLAGKDMIILQCGSDWCVSGEDVRKVFLSPEFRKATLGRYDLLVYDDMENPTEKVKEANRKIERLLVKSKRFPAITCLTEAPRRFFAQIENIPFDITAEELAEILDDAVKTKRKAENHFKRGGGKSAKSADDTGRGFELLESQVGELNVSALFEGPLAWTEQWEHLKKIDADDKYGWCRRFTMGHGFDLVEAASEYGKNGESKKGEQFMARLRSIPTNNLSVVQRQALQMVEFAFARGSSSPNAEAESSTDTGLLKRVLEMGRDTVWGQCALGFLSMAGENIERIPPHRAEVRERPSDAAAAQTPKFPLDKVTERIRAIKPGSEGFTDREKRDIALYAVLRRIGEDGWDKLTSRPGSRSFIKAFFSDREWMEDFVWSGRCEKADESILALEEIYFQDDGRWMPREDRSGLRFATATALEKPDASTEFLADWLDAYRTTALSNRLHKTAYTQGVWQWRYAIHQIHGSEIKEDPPNQQRFLDKFYNVSASDFGGAVWMVPYRMHNCFGESVHGPNYYKPWEEAGEWPRLRYSYLVGGVCGQLSTFASRCSNAHGLPSITVGQPGHCAFTRRMPDGRWVIDNFISPPTGFSAFWSGAHHWTYTAATEGTYVGERELRLDAERYLELAHLAESSGAKPVTVMKLYRRACGSWRKHYTAWRSYGDWIVRAGRSLEEHRTYAKAAVKTLEGWRHPLWDLLTPYFKRVGEENGAEALTEAIEEFAPLLRQPDEKLQDDGDFSSIVKRWTQPLESNPELMDRAVECIAGGQYGTKTYFTQVLGWCAPYVFETEKRAKAFMKLLPKFAEKFAKSMRGVIGGAKAINEAKNNKPDLGVFILAAEKSGNIAAFRQFAAMQEKIGRPVAGLRFPERTSNGVLVSAEGMLTTSGSCPSDTPTLHPRAIDASAVQGFTFAADQWSDSWAMVTLAGMCNVRSIVVVLRGPSEEVCKRQLPIEIEISQDGTTWQTVHKDSQLRDQYRVEFPLYKAPKARYVRVRRTQGETDDGRKKLDTFSLSKILVYGRKLY